MTKNIEAREKASASARLTNVPISTKHSVMISRFLRYKRTDSAKKLLEGVVNLRRAVPFSRYNRDMGHKAGMAAGRFPQKAAWHFLGLIKAVEANAQFKGMNPTKLKITKIVANKASIPLSGSRLRRATKRTHLEVHVMESSPTKDVATTRPPQTKVAAKKENKPEVQR